MFQIELVTVYLAYWLFQVIARQSFNLSLVLSIAFGFIFDDIALKCSPCSVSVQYGTFELDVPCTTVTFNSSVTVWEKSFSCLHTLLLFMI